MAIVTTVEGRGSGRLGRGSEIGADRLWEAGTSALMAWREDVNQRETRHHEGARADRELIGSMAAAQLSFAQHTNDGLDRLSGRLLDEGRANRETLAGLMDQQGTQFVIAANTTADAFRAGMAESSSARREILALAEQFSEREKRMAEIALRQMETQERSAQREIGSLNERVVHLEELLKKMERKLLEECLSICKLAETLSRQNLVDTLKEKGKFYSDQLRRIDRTERDRQRAVRRREQEERRRVEQEARRARETELAEAAEAHREETLESRNRRIEMTKNSLQIRFASLQDQRSWVGAACIIALIALPILCYKCSDERGLLTFPLTALSWAVVALTFRSFDQEATKKKWVGFYLKALDRLAADEKLTVRSAVKAQLEDDRTITPEILQSEEVQRALGRIADSLVEGKPDEATSAIPAALRTLVEHAEQPSSTFVRIDRVGGFLTA